ncbi:recA [Symbiodinium natans]|uniref:RecA protein n=1 Tax=Symbiodinium natans TaxID=878477 RepID=A0A812S5T0_9DINO|nr:recA [Symbiodinium natans]
MPATEKAQKKSETAQKKSILILSMKLDPKMDVFMKNFSKKYGEGSIMNLNKFDADVPTISTGALTLDLKLGGGVPYGRIVEVYGPEQSGKTTLALSCAYQAQQSGNRKRVAFLDAEQALDRYLAKNMGLDLSPDRFTFLCAGFAEEACDQLLDAIESKCFDIVILDSVGALTPKDELDKDMTQNTIGLLARTMSKFLRKAVKVVADSDTCLLIINQLRANIGGYGNPETTCGGKALPYHASMRLEVRSPMSGKMGPAEEPTGIRSVVRVKKNKLAAPHRKAEFDIIFGKGISWENSVVEAGIDTGLIHKAGAWMSYGEHRVQGKEKMRDLLEEHPDVCKKLEGDIRSAEKTEGSELEEKVEAPPAPEPSASSAVAAPVLVEKLQSKAPKAPSAPEPSAFAVAAPAEKPQSKAPQVPKKMNAADLKDELRKLGLPTTGNKAELTSRLQEAKQPAK